MSVSLECFTWGMTFKFYLFKSNFSWQLSAVYTSYWYLEHRLHLCWGINREAPISWKKCCSSSRIDHWSFGDTFTRNHFRSMASCSISFLFVCVSLGGLFCFSFLECQFVIFVSHNCRFEMRKQENTWQKCGVNILCHFRRSFQMQTH